MMFFNSKLKYYRWDKELFIKGSYTREELEYLYENVILYNLSKIFKVPHSEFIWRDISEITVIGKELVDNFPLNDHNSFLKDDVDKTMLANELLNSGFYLPVYTSINDEDQVEVDAGKHRITSVKLLESQGLWDGRKILTVHTDVANVKHYKYMKDTLPRNLSNDIIMRVPMCLLFSTKYIFMDDDFITTSLNSINGKRISNDIVEIAINKTPKIYKSILFTGYWVTEMFHAYRTYTGDNIEPSPIINSEQEFEKWRKKNE